MTHINLTKLDVLSELETIKLGVGYQVDGKSIPSVPSEIATLEKVEMVYEDIPGWQTDISKVRRPSTCNAARSVKPEWPTCHA